MMEQGKGFLLAMAMLAVPLVGWIASRLIVRGTGGFLDLAKHHALHEWHGAYYEFDGRQVRIFEDEGRLWFVAIDVARALGWRRIPHRFLSTQRHRLRPVEGTRLQATDMAGLEILLGARREQNCGRFLRWARSEVEAPWLRKREDRRLQAAAKS
jgi:hypothetical protein